MSTPQEVKDPLTPEHHLNIAAALLAAVEERYDDTVEAREENGYDVAIAQCHAPLAAARIAARH